MTRTGAVGGFTDAESHGDADTPAPTGWRSWSPPSVRRNRRTLIVFGVAIVALMVAGVGRGRGAQEGAEPAAEVFWRHALAEGTPVVQSPVGSSEARPRVIMALVPVGSAAARVTVLDDAGKATWEREAKSGFEGCFVEATWIDAPGGAFSAGRLLVPFPDEATLALAPGRGYAVVVTVAGSHASSSAPFQVRPPSGPLHGAPAEAR
jgi:hypothetical protein